MKERFGDEGGGKERLITKMWIGRKWESVKKRVNGKWGAKIKE